MIDFEEKRQFDFSLFFSAIALWIIGIFLVYSATHIHQSGPLAGIVWSQVLWVSLAVTIVLIVVSIPTVFYYSTAYIIYAGALMLLCYAVFMGVVSKGASRWIAVGAFRMQPSEFAKIGLLLALARYLSTSPISLERLRSLIVPAILIGIPFALVMKQPDLGTAMVFCAMSLPMFFWAGLPLRDIFLLVSPAVSLILSAVPLIMAFTSGKTAGIGGAIPWGLFFLLLCAALYFIRPRMLILVACVVANLAVPAATNILWGSMLKDYQKLRIISFVNPQQDPAGAGYQVIQSKVAIGSGHLFGKGYLQGTQTRLSFLPEQHTDFIFSVLGEQFGFGGALIVLGLFMFVMVRGYLTPHVVRNRFVNIVVVGATTIIAFHVFINIAMTLGMMPVTGIPLPFLSYGGSFAFTIAVLIGLVLNARTSRHDF